MSFDLFWSTYPRKMARRDAIRAWAKLSPSDQELALSALPLYIQYWAATATEKQFIPYPATWLNGHRFHDELEMPKPKSDPSWRQSEAGILAEGKRRGLYPRPGENLWDFRGRVEAA